MLLLAACTANLYAQSESDALRYSTLDLGGSTARSLGVGGSLSALGADFSVMSTNPAGLAWYRASEFSITPGFAIVTAKSKLSNDKSSSPSTNETTPLTVSNLGLVISATPSVSDWKSFNFGVGFNRLASFGQETFFTGVSTGSVVDRFLELANASESLDPFEAGLAADAEALICCDNNNRYLSDLELAPDAGISKAQTIDASGSINELTFSLAGNYKEKVMIGATIGVPVLSFTEDKVYEEKDLGTGPEGDVPYFTSLKYNQRLNTHGLGFNAKLGIIVRPNQGLRLGVAIHSPTFYSLEDNYTSELEYNYVDNNQNLTNNAASPDGVFEYKLRTPWRVLGSAGLILGKYGFISGEAEYMDFTKSRYDFGGFVADEAIANDSIQTKLGQVMNYRFGGEFAYEKFRFRAGVGLQASGLEGDATLNPSYSFGIGIRGEKSSVDLGYRATNIKETYIPYLTSTRPQQFVENDVNRGQLVLSLGFRFQ